MPNREIREAKALAIVKAVRPEVARPIVPTTPRVELIPTPPPRPDPTFTLWGFPEGTEFTPNIVYFMYSAGRVKIGYSGGIRGRHKTLKTAGAIPPVVLLVMKGGEAEEKRLHRQFANDRLHGEWFSVSKDIRTFLRQRLCEVGRATLEKAENEFLDYCRGFVDEHRPLGKPLQLPRKDRPKPVCLHGVRLSATCPHCERERDLAILEQINNGT